MAFYGMISSKQRPDTLFPVEDGVAKEAVELMRACWAEEPFDRPSAATVWKTVKDLSVSYPYHHATPPSPPPPLNMEEMMRELEEARALAATAVREKARAEEDAARRLRDLEAERKKWEDEKRDEARKGDEAEEAAEAERKRKEAEEAAEAVIAEAERKGSEAAASTKSDGSEDNKLIRSNEDIKTAVNAWCADKHSAEGKYGHISQWDTSNVTIMRNLFKDKQDFNDDISLFDQEYPITPEHAFRASGGAVFSVRAIEALEERAESPREYKFVLGEIPEKSFVPSIRGGLRVYQPPMQGHQYIAGVDIAGGYKDGDYSTMVILDREHMNVVAVYEDRLDPDTYSQLVDALGRRYNNAFLCVESNNHGLLVIHNLTKVHKYPTRSLYRRWAYDNVFKKNSWVVGFVTSHTTKPMVINSLRRAVADLEVNPMDMPLLQQLREYQRILRGNKELFEAPVGKHDDLVMALALAYHAALQTDQLEKAAKKVAFGQWTLEGVMKRAKAYQQNHEYEQSFGSVA